MYWTSHEMQKWKILLLKNENVATILVNLEFNFWTLADSNLVENLPGQAAF